MSVSILTTVPFGDVDYGPSAGVMVVARRDGRSVQETAEAVWAYFTDNYQDAWQGWELWDSGDDDELVGVRVYTFWGDGHRSVVK